MTDALSVRLRGLEVARLSRLRGTSELRYTDEYAALPGAVPISLSLPVTQSTHRGAVVDQYLDNLLPDNSAVRDTWAREAGLASSEPMVLLGAYGQDVAGAFSYHGAAGDDDEPVEVSQADIAAMIRGMRDDVAKWQPAAGHGRFSLAGAQAKTSLHHDGLRWFVTRGAQPSTHILKPHIPGYDDSDLVEHVTMLAATRVGLAAAKTWIGMFEGERTLVVERFDRHRAGTGRLLRLHQEDMAQALGVSRLRKFQAHGGPSPEDLLHVLNRTAHQWAADANKQDYLKQLAFHWMVVGTDAHAKNYSVFLLGDDFVLTPMYDAMSFLPYLDAKGVPLQRAIGETELAANIGTDYTVASAGTFEWAAIARKARLPDFDLVEWMRRTLPRLASEVTDECERMLTTYNSPTLRRLRDRTQQRHELGLKQLR